MNLQAMYHKYEHKNRKTTATCIDLVLRQSTQSWNACQIIFIYDIRFSEQSRGFQCTGKCSMYVIMLSLS